MSRGTGGWSANWPVRWARACSRGWRRAFGARQLAKLVPVYGQTAGAAAAAAMSFATTYALGKAAVVYLERRSARRSGIEGVREAYEEALARARSRWPRGTKGGGRRC